MTESCENIICLVAASIIKYPGTSKGGFGLVRRVKNFCLNKDIVGEENVTILVEENVDNDDVNEIIKRYRKNILEWEGVLSTDICKKIFKKLDLLYKEKSSKNQKVINEVLKEVDNKILEPTPVDNIVDEAIQIIINYYKSLKEKKEELEGEWEILSSKIEDNDKKLKELIEKFDLLNL